MDKDRLLCTHRDMTGVAAIHWRVGQGEKKGERRVESKG
jgi:hypothetical protein